MLTRARNGLMFAVAALLVCPPARAEADSGFFIGDSIAAGLASTLKMRSAARSSVSLMRETINTQFARLPSNSVVLMSLGVNDAATPVQSMRHHIERIVGVALKSGHRVVWIGPPCVLKSWDVRAKEMDEYLAARLRETTIQYVSLRDEQICQKKLRDSDGVHFTAGGNKYVWAKIKRDAPYAALIGN